MATLPSLWSALSAGIFRFSSIATVRLLLIAVAVTIWTLFQFTPAFSSISENSNSIHQSVEIGNLEPTFSDSPPEIGQTLPPTPEYVDSQIGDALGNNRNNAFTIQIGVDTNTPQATGLLVRYIISRTGVNTYRPNNLGRFVPFVDGQSTYTVTFRNGASTPISTNSRYNIYVAYAKSSGRTIADETNPGFSTTYLFAVSLMTEGVPGNVTPVPHPTSSVVAGGDPNQEGPHFVVAVTPDSSISYANGVLLRYREVGTTTWYPTSDLGRFVPYTSGETRYDVTFADSNETPISSGVDYEVEVGYALTQDRLLDNSTTPTADGYSSHQVRIPSSTDFHPQNISVTHSSAGDSLTVTWEIPSTIPEDFVGTNNGMGQVREYWLRYKLAGTDTYNSPLGVVVSGTVFTTQLSSCTDPVSLPTGDNCIAFSRGNTYVIEMAQVGVPNPKATVPTGGEEDWAILNYTVPFSDTPSGPSISDFTLSANSVNEGGEVTVTVTLDTAPMVAGSIDVIIDDTGRGSADIGDISISPQTLNFAVDQTSAMATITAVDDDLLELTENVFIGLFNESTIQPSTQDSLELSIVDTDTTTVGVDFSAAPTALTEENVLEEESGTITITISLSNPIDNSCVLRWKVPFGGDKNRVVTEDFVTGSPFLMNSNMVTFAPGETEKMYTVAVVDDQRPEFAESLIVNVNSTIGEDGFDCGTEFNDSVGSRISFPSESPQFTIARNDLPVITSVVAGDNNHDLDRALTINYTSGTGSDMFVETSNAVRFAIRDENDTTLPDNPNWIRAFNVLKTDKNPTIPHSGFDRVNRLGNTGQEEIRLLGGTSYWVQIGTNPGEPNHLPANPTTEADQVLWGEPMFASTEAEIIPVVTVADVAEGQDLVVEVELPETFSVEVVLSVQLEVQAATHTAEADDFEDTAKTITIDSGETTGSVSFSTTADTDSDDETVLVNVSTEQFITLPTDPVATILEAAPAPSGVMVVAGAGGGTPPLDVDRALSVSWTAPSGSSIPTIEAFEVGWVAKPVDGSIPEDSLWDTARTTDGTTTSLVIPTGNRLLANVGLEADTTYLVRVSSVVTGQDQLWSDIVEVTTGPSIELTFTLTPNPLVEGSPLTVGFRLSGAVSQNIQGFIRVETGEEDNTYTSEHDDFDLTAFGNLPERLFGFASGGSGSVSGETSIGTREDADSQDETFRVYVDILNNHVLTGGDWSEVVTISDPTVLPVSGVMLEAGSGMGRDQDRSLAVEWTVPDDLSDFDSYVVSYRQAAADGNPAGEWSDPIAVTGDNTVEEVVFSPDSLVAGDYEVRVGSVATGEDPVWSTVSNKVTVIAPITLSFTSESLAVSAIEGGRSNERSIDYQVTLSGTRSVPVKFRISYRNMSASNGDYNWATIERDISPGRLGFAVGHLQPAVAPFHSVTDDDLVEGDETFEAVLSILDGEVLANPQRATVTITDTDTAEVGLVSPTTISVAEDVDGGTENQFDFEVTLSAQVDADVTVNWNLVGADATDVEGGQTSGMVTFPARQTTSQPVTIVVADDTDAELAENWTFGLSNIVTSLTRSQSPDPVSFATSVAEVMLMVEESDVDLGPAVSAVTATQGGENGVDPDRVLSVSWEAATGNVSHYLVEYVTNASDMMLENLTLETWSNGTALTQVSGLSATIEAPAVVQDQFYRFRVAAVTAEPSMANWQLSNVVSPADPIEVSLAETAVEVGEGDGLVEVDVQLSGPRSEAVSVMVVVSADTAVATDDFGEPAFDSNSGTGGTVQVDIAAGDEEETVSVPIVGDEVVEGNEIFTVGLGSSPSDNVEVSDSELTITITDDDTASVGVEVASNMADEDRTAVSDPNHMVELTLTLSKQVAEPVMVTLTAAGDAVAEDISWAGLVEQVTIPANTDTHSVNLEIIDDEIAEEPETLEITVSDPQVNLTGRMAGDVLSVDSNKETVSITIAVSDGGVLPPVMTAVTAESGQLINGNRVDNDQVFSVSWTALSAADLANVVGYVARFAPAPTGGETLQDSAWTELVAVEDPAITSITIFDGTISADTDYLVAVSAVRDDINSSLRRWSESAMVSTAEAILVSLSSDSEVLETRSDPASNNSLTVTASLNGLLSVPVSVEVSTTAGSATETDDYVGLAMETVTIPAGEGSGSVAVEIVDDEVVEGSEDFMVSIVGSPTGTAADTDNDEISVSIVDDDVAVLRLGILENGNAVSTVNVDEDRQAVSDPTNTVELQLTLSHAVAADLSVTLTVSGTNVDADDIGWAGLSEPITIPAGMTSRSVVLEIVDDDEEEGTENVGVTVSDPQVIWSGRTADEAVSINTNSEMVTVVVAASDGGELPPEVSGVSAAAGQLLDGSRVDEDRMIAVSWTVPSDTTQVVGYVVRFVEVPSDESSPAEDDWTLVDPIEDPAATGTVLVVADGVLADTEYFVAVSALQGNIGSEIYRWIPAGSVVITAPAVTVGLSADASVAESRTDPAVNNSVTVRAALSGVLSVPVSLEVSTTAGSATEVDDYVALTSETITIAAGEESSEVLVEIVEDEIVEGTEDFVVEIVGTPTGAGPDSATERVSIEITDDDTASVSARWAGSPPTSGVLPLVIEDVDGGALNELTFDIVVDKQVTVDVIVDWEIVTNSEITAADFETSPLSGQFTITANSLVGHTETVTVVVADDSGREPQEQVRFQITVTPVVLIGRSDSPVAVDPTAGEVIAAIAASDQPDLSVLPTNVMVSSGDEAGQDIDRKLRVSWEAPTNSANVTGYRLRYKMVTEDEWSEPIEVTGAGMLTHTIESAAGFEAGDYQVSVEAVGGTTHDPVISPQTVAVAPITAAITETELVIDEGSSGQLTITLSGGRSEEVIIEIATTPGTAEMTDFQVPGQVTFAIGETSHTIQVSAIEDSNDESEEMFAVSLISPAQTANVDVDTTTVTVTINNTTASTTPSGGSTPTGGVGGFPGGGTTPVTQPPSQTPAEIPTFIDTVGNTHESNIGMLASLGITRGCNPPTNDRYCPDRAVTRGEMATFMVRAFSLADSSENLFGDDDGNTHEANINRLATAEITRGCNPPENTRYCPERPVTRAQMATFIARVLDLAEGSGDFTDTADSVHQNDINRIATVGITRGCNPPENSRYCPDRPVTRAEMATFLIRAQNLS